MIQHNYFWFVAQAKAMFLFCNHALITKVSTLLDIYKGCQRRQVQNRMGHIQISITTKIIIFLKSGRKTFKTIFCALSITEKYINLVNILRKKRASPLQVWCLVWIARCYMVKWEGEIYWMIESGWFGQNILYQFLDASTQIYKRLCLSIGRSVGWSVGRSADRSFGWLVKLEVAYILQSSFDLRPFGGRTWKIQYGYGTPKWVGRRIAPCWFRLTLPRLPSKGHKCNIVSEKAPSRYQNIQCWSHLGL